MLTGGLVATCDGLSVQVRGAREGGLVISAPAWSTLYRLRRRLASLGRYAIPFAEAARLPLFVEAGRVRVRVSPRPSFASKWLIGVG